MSNKAIFFDRDGVINKETGNYVYKVADFEFHEDVFQALKQVPADFKKIIVTNQAGIAKGIYTEQDYRKVTQYMLSELKKQEININSVCFCPHHPQGIVEQYKIDCDCRKPKPGMLLQAAKEFDIDLKNSWIIGDKTSDIEAGKNAGTKTILVQTGYGGGDNLYNTEADHVSANLSVAITIIRKHMNG